MNGQKTRRQAFIRPVLILAGLLFFSLGSVATGEEDATQDTGIYTALSLGTAWAITRTHVVTNYHVVANTKNLRLVTPNQMEIPVKIVATDPDNDLAILVLQGRARLGNSLPLSNKSVNLGTPVFTIGYPHPDLMGTSPKLTAGHVNALTGIADDPRIYQVDVPVQAGNSGGPLLNMHGEVIAVISSKLNAKKMFDRTGDVPQNVNYAIKINQLNKLLDKAKIQGEVRNTGYKKRQSLEKLAGKSLDSVLIVAGDAKHKKKQPAKVAYLPERIPAQPVPKEAETVIASDKIKLVLYSYSEPDSYYRDDNMAASNTVEKFSRSISKVMETNLGQIYGNRFEVKQFVGDAYKRVHFKLDVQYQRSNFCHKDKADIIISSYSEDNSGIGQHFRDIAYIIIDCSNYRMFRQKLEIRRADLTDQFDYESGVHYSFKKFVQAIPPFIEIKKLQQAKSSLGNSDSRFVIYSYAQPSKYDKDANVTGSKNSRIYSQNTARLIQNHLKSRFGDGLTAVPYSGKSHKSVYYKLEEPEQLRQFCKKDSANYVLSSYSENSGGRFIHFRHVKYIIANCESKRVYKRQYKLERDERNDGFGYEMALHGTFQDFLSTLPPFIMQ